jgi:uncharacterized protein YyaL (SSP411 family)
MAHESFEDADTAALMNALFVNIKVDREERPDLDQIYQTAHYMLTRRSGGWPLTMFLTPEQMPFVGGTYFPKTPRYGMLGFRELLTRVADIYRTRRGDIEKQNASLLAALGAMSPAASAQDDLDTAPITGAIRALERMFDPKDGGFGQAPKCPHPYELDFLLRQRPTADRSTRDMVTLTLTRMAEGGVYDQVGGGFCRYSVDAHWGIPHFEKMLYDNGPLLALYADAGQATEDPLYARVVEQTAQWVMREMQSPAGGYYSSLDADAEHVEGKYYVWTPDEVRACLDADEYAVIEPLYGLDAPANFEQAHWHLRIAKPLAHVAKRTGFSTERCDTLVESARAKLYARREQRVRPGRDEKILTSWNALMIRGMARAGRRMGRTPWIDSAQRALDFIRSHLWQDGRLLATHKDGRTHLNAYLDDYAFLLDAILEALQARFRSPDLAFACALADTLLARFEDPAGGGFFFTSHDHERLIQRPKPSHDSATPSGNGIAAYALARLGHIVGEPRYLASATRTIALFLPHLREHPNGFPSLLNALAEQLHPPRIVVLRGPADQLPAWQASTEVRYRPDVITLAVPNGTAALPGTLDHPQPPAVNAWVCQGVKCLPPLADTATLEKVLNGTIDG